MPHIKPSPPERAAIGGMLVENPDGFDEEDEDKDREVVVVVFFPQQITFCLPLASMAQKKPSPPNAAEMGPIDPNPCVNLA